MLLNVPFKFAYAELVKKLDAVFQVTLHKQPEPEDMNTDSAFMKQVQAHIASCFSTPEEIVKTFLEIQSSAIRDYICYQVWILKGRVDGVHPDFGRLSYLRDPVLNSHYHCTDDDRMQILLDLSEKLAKL